MKTEKISAAVPLPDKLRQRALALNIATLLALLIVATALLASKTWLAASILLAASGISIMRLRGLLRGQHVAIEAGTLRSYDPHRGNSNAMSVADIASIQFRPSSGKGLLRTPARFVVRGKKNEREMPVFLLTDSQQPILAAFFRQQFPEHYQEPTGLPGFPVSPK